MAIRDLTDGSSCDLVLLVRAVERRQRKDGRDFLKVTFADRTGTLQANVWDDVDEVAAEVPVGAAVHVRGRFEVHEKFGAQLRLEAVRPAADGTYDPTELRSGPPVSVAALEERLRALVASVSDPGMATLLARILGEGTPTWEAYRVAPAAKRVHQAYRHGLLEHCLTVAEAVAGVAGVFPGIDRDLAVAAALVHDLGKLEAYELVEGDTVELTDAGRLRGEIVLGYERLHRELRSIDGLSEERIQAFLHIILSHHGHLEHGSPVVPQTREAFLVHMMDNLGGKLGIIDRLEQERAPDAAWSNFDRAYGAAVWFPPGQAGVVAAQAAPAPPLPVDLPPVPRAAFEESGAWQPPAPEALAAPPVPAEPFTQVPEAASAQPAPPDTQTLPF